MIGMNGSIDNKDFVDCQEDSMKDQREELRVLEAILFAVSEPVTEGALANRLPEGADIPSLIQELSRQYEGRGIVLQAVAGRWAFRNAPDLSGVLEMPDRVFLRDAADSRGGLSNYRLSSAYYPWRD